MTMNITERVTVGPTSSIEQDNCKQVTLHNYNFFYHLPPKQIYLHSTETTAPPSGGDGDINASHSVPEDFLWSLNTLNIFLPKSLDFEPVILEI
jgi:hypothetical protein